jgi:hypothetical protein
MMTDEALRRQIAALAKDSSRVVITNHMAARMVERNVSDTQVFEVLRKGTVCEPAHLNIHGNWQCNLERTTAGDLVRVTCVVDDDSDPSGTVVVVKTVMKPVARPRKR